MQADYRVNSIYVDEETGEIFAKCYDNVYGEEFEKYLGSPNEYMSRLNASAILEDSNFSITDELKNEIISTFGLEDFGHEILDVEDYDDEIYAGNANGIVTEEELDSTYKVKESFSLREALNKIDLITDNKYDLRNLYEACDLSENEKRALANIVYDQNDPSVIYDTLNDRFVSGEEIGMPERVKDGVIHEDKSDLKGYTIEKQDNYFKVLDDNGESLDIDFESEDDAREYINTISDNDLNESKSIKEDIGETIASTIDGSELVIDEENIIPNTRSFKATYTTGDSKGATYIFVEADDKGTEYLETLGFKPEVYNGDKFIDLPTECLKGNNFEGSFYITKNDFSEYGDLKEGLDTEKWPWLAVYPELEKAVQAVYEKANWSDEMPKEETAQLDAKAAKVAKELVDEHKGDEAWEEAYRRLLDIAPELELKESLNENAEIIFAGINHDDAGHVTLVKDTEDNISRLEASETFGYYATIPATNNIIFIENNDENISIDDTGFTSLEQIKDEIKRAIEIEMENYPGEDSYEVYMDVPPYYVFLENVSSVDEGVKIALEEITNSYVDCDSSSNYMFLNGSNFDIILNGSSDVFVYANVDELLENNGLAEEIDDDPHSLKHNKQTAIEWLQEHDQAWEDITDFFGSNDLEEIDFDEIMAWIDSHDELSYDFWKHFGDECLEESLNESTGKTFAQWFDETQQYGDDEEFYPFSNYIKAFPNAEVLANVTAEDIKANAHKFSNIYDVDSTDREKAFTFASEELGLDYDVFYHAWLKERPIDGGTNESLNEAAQSWHDIYKIFLDIVDATLPEPGYEDKIAKDVEALYRKHEGEAAWDSAWLRWLDHTLEPGDEGFEEADALYKSELARIRGNKTNESVYADEPSSREDIELDLKNATENFTNRQGTVKCGFKEEADIGYDILKQYYGEVEVEEKGEWFHLTYKDKLEESLTHSPLSTAGPIPYAVKLLYMMDRFVMDVYDNEGWLMNGVPDGEFEETTSDEAMQNYTDHMWLIEDADNAGEINWDDFKDFLDTFKHVTRSSSYDQEERARIIAESEEFLNSVDKPIDEAWEPEFSDVWRPEDIELWKSIDWKERNYLPYIDNSNTFRGEVVAYGLPGGERKAEVMFAKEISPNPIFEPKWVPTSNPFEGTVGFIYDGVKHTDGYMMMTRTETQDVYDALSH